MLSERILDSIPHAFIGYAYVVVVLLVLAFRAHKHNTSRSHPPRRATDLPRE
jgi:hypothetical protein